MYLMYNISIECDANTVRSCCTFAHRYFQLTTDWAQPRPRSLHNTSVAAPRTPRKMHNHAYMHSAVFWTQFPIIEKQHLNEFDKEYTNKKPVTI